VKHYKVKYLASARRDILELMRFLAERESPDRARSVLRQIRERCDDLETMPRRGHVPPELRELSIGKFLELHFKPYRRRAQNRSATRWGGKVLRWESIISI